MYLLAYRDLGIFQENVVNRVLRDVVKAANPVSATVIGEFTPRGGLSTVVTASLEPSGERVESAELIAILREVRERVRARRDPARSAIPRRRPVDIALPDLMPLVHARDAAMGKVAAIGTVNPRRGGPLNALVQAWKRLVARVLDWHVREQVEFNRNVIAAVRCRHRGPARIQPRLGRGSNRAHRPSSTGRIVRLRKRSSARR